MIKKIKEHTIHSDQFMKIWLDDVELPNGKASKYIVIDPKPGSFIMAQDESGKWLVAHEWRYPINGWTWGWPAGGVNLGETFIDGAKREFEEETGRTAKEWVDLGELRSDPGKSTHKVHYFIAKGVKEDGKKMLEPGEIMEHHWLSESEIRERIISNEFNDGWLLKGWGLLEAHGYLKKK